MIKGNDHRVGILTLLLLTLSFAALSAQDIDHWETMIAPGVKVKYIVPQQNVPSDWITSSFDDDQWETGTLGIGYGDGDDNTVIPDEIDVYSVYIRYKFNITDKEKILALILDMDYDDAFVAYLNGVEIARYNIGSPGETTTFNQSLPTDIEANLHRDINPHRFIIKENYLDALSNGENLFTVEVHNTGPGSSDLSSNAFLHCGLSDATTYFNAVPEWFTPPIFEVSKLPLMVIETSGQSIASDPRIIANMGLIYNGPDETNAITDSSNIYNGRISIEIRGASSQGFEKKSYTIETQTDSGTNNNISLLGLPKENDYILYAPYSDKSLVRNVISYRLYEQMGHWSPRTRIINLYLNNDYQGIYILTEKIKIDPNRVNIKPLTSEDVEAKRISGGYILQVDRTSSLLASEYWTSPVSSPYSGFDKSTFEYYDPKRDELTTLQANYIKSWMNEFDSVLAGSNFEDPTNGYRKYIDVPSFVDYFIFHELNKDVDAYRLSTFFYKASDYQGGKLHAGPVWDYNLTYGNMDYGTNIKETYDWMYNLTAGKYWWKRLMDDEYFDNEVKCRWTELRNSLLDSEHMNSLIDSAVLTMGESVDLNFQRWPILGTYVWPNSFVGNTHEEELNFLKSWISDRIAWLDNNWLDKCEAPTSEGIYQMASARLSIYPNPSDGKMITISLPDENLTQGKLFIYNMQGKLIFNKAIEGNAKTITLDNLALPSGIYLINVSAWNKLYSGKIIIN